MDFRGVFALFTIHWHHRAETISECLIADSSSQVSGNSQIVAIMVLSIAKQVKVCWAIRILFKPRNSKENKYTNDFINHFNKLFSVFYFVLTWLTYDSYLAPKSGSSRGRRGFVYGERVFKQKIALIYHWVSLKITKFKAFRRQ